MRKHSPWLMTLLLFLAGTLMLNARRPLMTTLDVAPNPAQSGQELAVNSSLTNNSSDVQMVTVQLQMRGPCGVSASRGYKVVLNSHQSEAAKTAFRAPACPGGYQAILTASDHDGGLLGTSATNFEVTASTAR